MRRRLDDGVGPLVEQLAQAGDERYAVGFGERLAARCSAAPEDCAHFEVAERAAGEMLQDQAGDHPAADDADAHDSRPPPTGNCAMRVAPQRRIARGRGGGVRCRAPGHQTPP
jgi:hypothetical protein